MNDMYSLTEAELNHSKTELSPVFHKGAGGNSLFFVDFRVMFCIMGSNLNPCKRDERKRRLLIWHIVKIAEAKSMIVL